MCEPEGRRNIAFVAFSSAEKKMHFYNFSFLMSESLNGNVLHVGSEGVLLLFKKNSESVRPIARAQQ